MSTTPTPISTLPCSSSYHCDRYLSLRTLLLSSYSFLHALPFSDFNLVISVSDRRPQSIVAPSGGAESRYLRVIVTAQGGRASEMEVVTENAIEWVGDVCETAVAEKLMFLMTAFVGEFG